MLRLVGLPSPLTIPAGHRARRRRAWETLADCAQQLPVSCAAGCGIPPESQRRAGHRHTARNIEYAQGCSLGIPSTGKKPESRVCGEFSPVRWPSVLKRHFRTWSPAPGWEKAIGHPLLRWLRWVQIWQSQGHHHKQSISGKQCLVTHLGLQRHCGAVRQRCGRQGQRVRPLAPYPGGCPARQHPVAAAAHAQRIPELAGECVRACVRLM